MIGPEIALAASARDWPDRLHRFLLDHGGGRVRARVMGPQQAEEEDYEVLLIDDVCSFLTPRLVRSLREAGREVVGVFQPSDGPDAKRHLLECGITDVVEADASPEEFITVATGTLTHRHSPPVATPAARGGSLRVGVAGASGGVGASELSLALAARLTTRRPTLLLDLDDRSPSLAQRLDLPLHPNLLTALDLAQQAPEELPKAIHELGFVDVVGGLAAQVTSPISAVEVAAVLDETAGLGYQVQVGDLGAGGHLSSLATRFDVVVVVGAASPVGITRLVRSIAALPQRRDANEVVAAVNRVTKGSTRTLEIRSELIRLMPDVPVLLIPEDRRLDRAAWDGSLVGRGPFVKAVDRLASLLDEVARR